ncbi:sugar ABC transporter ATP-binding protein [Nocardioides carbamazepini]|uniref:sugar ABC transporter ATP-binding protein n=1 Tax=Nocardioides carbamazepini TaxID=2854259 RepID=UPI002149BF06|nr:sugar ABC transporter ATP-binding protein [Nocardioides carbamazepini]MCR1783666.1 sugar ABC transporter ATP-binding protein [Nocardioides carbamazepini]
MTEVVASPSQGAEAVATVAPAVSVRGVSKTFAGTRALDDVDLDVRPGEIHALCGGNGSGKSTLIKILSGVYQADPGGVIRVDDEDVAADAVTPGDASRLSICTVHQDLAVFPDLSVAENLAIGGGFETALGGRIRWGRQRRQAARLIERFGIPATPRTRLASLTVAARTQVAIARALQAAGDDHRGLLILDEPTAALPVKEVEQLLEGLRKLAAQGQSILYVSHRLDEVLDLCDRVTVLRDGRRVATTDTADLDEQGLIELMLGRTVEHQLRHEPRRTDGAPLLEIRHLASGPLRDVSLTLHEGEVLGIAGLLGSGRSTLLRTVFGDRAPDGGDIAVGGRSVRYRRPIDAIADGIVMVPENRLQDAAFTDLTVDMNGALSVIGGYWRGGFLRGRRLREDGRDLIAEFGVKTPTGAVPLSALSGGNQQKVVMARWMRRKPQVLLLDEPTQGVDVGARADIYRLVREATDNGSGAIVVASDFEELAHVADRVLVLRRGRVVAEVSGADITAHRLTELSLVEGKATS